MTDWTRAELKTRAKATLKMYYWQLVLVSFILMVVTGGVGSGVSNKVNKTTSKTIMSNGVNQHVYEEYQSGDTDIDGLLNSLKVDNPAAIFAAIAAISMIVLIVCVFALLMKIFLFNPLIVSCKRILNHALCEEPNLGDLGYAFSNNYLNIVKIMFLKDLYVGLWSLLFVIPGIVKGYEYRMIPYILGEHPDMDSSAVFEETRNLMTGNKWNTFVLDLSFILWMFLSVIFIVHILWVAPYIYLTDAALYRKLSGADNLNFGWDANGYPNGSGYNQSYGQNPYGTAYTQPENRSYTSPESSGNSVLNDGQNPYGTGYDQSTGQNSSNPYGQGYFSEDEK